VVLMFTTLSVFLEYPGEIEAAGSTLACQHQGQPNEKPVEVL
jgi:hypothetical protein